MKLFFMAACMAAQAAPEGRFGQIVCWPGRLPGHQKVAAFFAQFGPLRIIARFEWAQIDALAANGVGRLCLDAQSKKRHLHQPRFRRDVLRPAPVS
jgi:hypothetical protein